MNGSSGRFSTPLTSLMNSLKSGQKMRLLIAYTMVPLLEYFVCWAFKKVWKTIYGICNAGRV